MAFGFVATLTELKAIADAANGLEKLVLDIGETGRSPARYVYKESSSLPTMTGIVEPSTGGLTGQWIKLGNLVYFADDSPSFLNIIPPFKGIHFIDTATDAVYVSYGTSSSSDWIEIGGDGGGGGGFD